MGAAEKGRNMLGPARPGDNGEAAPGGAARRQLRSRGWPAEPVPATEATFCAHGGRGLRLSPDGGADFPPRVPLHARSARAPTP
jgi:hypothetical protein